MRYQRRSHVHPTSMRHASKFRVLELLAALLLFAVPFAWSQQDFTSRALDYVASHEGIDVGQLSVAHASAAHFPLTGVTLADFKILSSDGRTFAVSFNAATGGVTDSAATAASERQARQTKYGVLEPALYARMQGSAAERIPVAIWVAMEEPGNLARGHNPNFQALAARVRTAQTPAADAAISLGAVVELADHVPVIFAQLNAGQITALSHHKDVVSIETVPQNLMNLLDDMGTSEHYTFVWGSSTGAGSTVAVHEDDGVDTTNTYLIDPIYWCTSVGGGPGGAGCTVGTNIGTHATNVAGVMVSTHPWRRGGAFGVAAGHLLSANFQSFSSAVNIVNSASWALNGGTDALNMSWGGASSGGQTFYTRWADYLVKTFGDSLVVSSGNDSSFVLSPSLGWNTISAGSYFDNDTGVIADDVLSSFTSFRNPTDPNSGRTYEKPDVVGMGGQVVNSPSFRCFGVETTAVGGGVNASTCGTSFAAPDVSALVALIVGKQPSLRNEAEAVKAVVMAGATHNIVDGKGYTDCSTSPFPGDCRDGAGGIDAFQSINNIVVPGNFRFSLVSDTSGFDASGNIDIPITLRGGKQFRAALAWDSTAVCSNLGISTQTCTSDVLNADLDLHLVNSANTIVASSSSFQNSAEVIDYTPGATGNFILRAHKFRFDAGTNTFLGLAWNFDTLNTRTPLTGATSFALNTTKTGQSTNKGRSFWDTYSGTPASCTTFLSNETGLEKLYSVTTTASGKITAKLTNITAIPGASSDLDVVILKKSGKPANQNSQVVACGDLQAVASAQPAGTYYIVVDGFGGSVAKFSLNVTFAAGQ